MATFTSSLPDNLLEELAKTAKELKMPKNKIIEKALAAFLEQIDRAKYAQSYKKMANDKDMIAMAEEGLADYFKQLQDLEKE
ncbi:ribbon-helix-helix domain-containing protein [Mesonia sp.]|uniref:ribbon-helix-helix domain-containing protein n=1 Tax=Mesonia sp. TaxID=1960830 RepID=UPI003F9AD1E3